MNHSLSVVDRLQGGAEALGRFQVESHALISIEKAYLKRPSGNNILMRHSSKWCLIIWKTRMAP